jgi:hypothetical protein
MSSSSISDQDTRKKKKKKIGEDTAATTIPTRKIPAVPQNASSLVYEAESLISKQVPQNRREEIYEYLKLFGYKPDRTILQVHITGFFKKKKYSQREIEQHRAAVKRYGGTTFVIVGRTHDPSIMNNIVTPKKKDPYERSPGYIGYLWKNKDTQKRAPHEVIPLDFTPIHLPYPTDWKNMFATKGFMLALHVPASFAKNKNKLTRALYRIGRKSNIVDIKKEWSFLDDLRNAAAVAIYPQKEKEYTKRETDQQKTYDDTADSYKEEKQQPIHILKTRLAKGQITKEEYQELRKAIEQ